MDYKRRWRSLNLKVEHLRLEVEERDETIQKFEKEFLEELSKIEVEEIPGVEQRPVAANVEVIEASSLPSGMEVEAASVDERPEDIKKLWRSIAILTHPDRTGNDPIKTEMYKKASDAFKSGSYDELFRIAASLGIELPEMGEGGIGLLQGISSDLEKKLKESEASVLWMWGTTSPEKRQGIIDIYLKSRGKKRKIQCNDK